MPDPVELLPPHEAVPSNPEWHRLRRAGIGGSEIAAVLGISPWESPFSLYWRKREGWDVEQADEMRAGTRAEPVIADWWADECDPHENLIIRTAGLYAHPARPWQMATPDRLIHMACRLCDGYRRAAEPWGCADCQNTGVDGPPIALLECKYVIGGWDDWGDEGTDDVPVYYRAQCLWQADVMGVDEVYLAAWHGADFRAFRIRRNDRAGQRDLQMMRAAGQAFMDRVAAGDAPDVDEHTATIRTLKALHPSIEDRKQEISAATADGYRRARALLHRAQAVADLFEARVRAEMGNARRAVAPDGRFVASRSIYDLGGEDYEVHQLDGVVPVVDRLNPARGKK